MSLETPRFSAKAEESQSSENLGDGEPREAEFTPLLKTWTSLVDVDVYENLKFALKMQHPNDEEEFYYTSQFSGGGVTASSQNDLKTTVKFIYIFQT